MRGGALSSYNETIALTNLTFDHLWQLKRSLLVVLRQ